MPGYYRVIYTTENIRNWMEGRYHSGHTWPQDWFDTWKAEETTEPTRYPLHCSTGYYSEAARSVFLRAAREQRVNSLSQDEAKAICELGGVCAWDSPEGAYGYLLPESPARRRNVDKYVAFVGEKLADDPVEGRGAVIARVIEAVDGVLNREEFRRLHRL